ncbi:hypothetical protein GGI14_004069 [Coemansia sp. S680]|nr:hypothetical protein GGI14_004069 [Coemansia sp. S680]
MVPWGFQREPQSQSGSLLQVLVQQAVADAGHGILTAGANLAAHCGQEQRMSVAGHLAVLEEEEEVVVVRAAEVERLVEPVGEEEVPTRLVAELVAEFQAGQSPQSEAPHTESGRQNFPASGHQVVASLDTACLARLEEERVA